MFANEVVFFEACINKAVFEHLILWFIFNHIFGPEKDKHFFTIIAFRRDMSSPICDLALYTQSEGLNISWIYLDIILFQYLKTLLSIPLCH